MSDPNSAENSWERIRRNPLVVRGAIVAAAGFIAAVLYLIGLAETAVDEARDVIDPPPGWREEEYEKIAAVRSGMSIVKVKEVLGSPLFERKSQDQRFTESTFQGRDYWVQTVHDPAGAVRLLAVTSCKSNFNPVIETPIGNVVLNKSHLDAVASEPTAIRYYPSPATANSFFFDEYWGANPGLYKTYFFGINDACPAAANYILKLVADGRISLDTLSYPDGVPYSVELPKEVTEFRTNSIMNTYAEMGPGPGPHSDSPIFESFQIGVDRILTRTVDLEAPSGGYPEEYSECARTRALSGDYLNDCADLWH